MSNKCASVCPKHPNSVHRSRSRSPNSQQKHNGSVRGGHNQQARNGHAGDSWQQNLQGSNIPQVDHISTLTAHAYNSYKQTYQVQEDAGCFDGKHTTGVTNNEFGSVPGNGTAWQYNENVNQKSAPQQQQHQQQQQQHQQQFSSYKPNMQHAAASHNQTVPVRALNNQTVPSQQNQQLAPNNNPINVVIRLQQGGNGPPASGQLKWTATNESGQQCSQTKDLDGWTGEEQFSLGGKAFNQNYNQQFSMGQQQGNQSQMQKQVNESLEQSSVITTPFELAMQVRPKCRFRAGGGGACCSPNKDQQGRGGQDMCSGQQQMQQYSEQQQQKSSCCPASEQQQQQMSSCCSAPEPQQMQQQQQISQCCAHSDSQQQQPPQSACCPGSESLQQPMETGYGGGPSFGNFPEMVGSGAGIPQPRRPRNLQCIDPCQNGMGAGSFPSESSQRRSFQPEVSQTLDEPPPTSSLQQSSSKGKSKSSRFEFTSPDTLRTKLQEYIHNRPMGTAPVGKLKPFLGPREDALSCRTCYTPADENTLPAACQPCGRLEMTAEDFENEELDAKKKIDDANALAEREKIMAEVACYKSIMPLDFTCNEQIEYMQCLGASSKAMNAFREMQQQEAEKKNGNGQLCAPCGDERQQTACGSCQPEMSGYDQSGRMMSTPSYDVGAGSSSNATKQEFLQQLQNVQNTPLPDPNYRKQVLARQVMPPSQRRRIVSKTDGSGLPITPIAEENEQWQSARSGAGGPDELSELLRRCREEFGVVNAMGQLPKSKSGGNADDMQDIVEEDLRLFLSQTQSQGEKQPSKTVSLSVSPEDHSASPDDHCKQNLAEEEVPESSEERAKLLEQYPQFSPPKQEIPRSLKETILLYKEHLANIRRRYFGKVVKSVDEVEDITPDIAAAMVFSEEEGQTMKSAPQKIYEYLYPENPSQPLVTIADVTRDLPAGYDDIVVPLIPPMFLTSAEFPGLEDPAMLDSPRVIQIGPSPNLAEEPMITETKAPTDIAELVTGMTEAQAVEVDEDEDEEGVQIEDVFNVKLPVTMPPHYSRMQMRGSQAPNWFPGYYVALQSKPGVDVSISHCNALEQVWRDVQPDAVRPAAGAIVIGE